MKKMLDAACKMLNEGKPKKPRHSAFSIQHSAFLFVASWGFTKVWSLPVVGLKIQPPELFFLVFLAASLPRLPEILKKAARLAAFEKWLLTLVAVAVAHGFLIGGRDVWLEIVGLGYLLAVFVGFKWLAGQFEPSVFLEKTARWLLIGGVLTAVAGVAGWAASYFFGIEGAAYSAKRFYPYLGYFGRARGFSVSVTMYAFVLALGGLGWVRLFSDQKSWGRWAVFALAAIAVGAVLSFSKNVFAGLAGLIWQRKAAVSTEKGAPNSFRGAVFAAALAACLAIYLVPTHLLLIEKATADWAGIASNSNALRDPAAFDFGEKSAHWTGYALFKKTAFQAGIELFPLGTGPKQHLEWVKKLQLEGRFPADFAAMDAHCLYTGTLGELGFFGLVALGGLFVSIFLTLKRLRKSLSPADWAFLAGFFWLFAWTSWTADTLNFRPFWAFLGILAAFARRD